jgi:2-hydroxy-6-oxonona-2,4-dienedioate hydrolase
MAAVTEATSRRAIDTGPWRIAYHEAGQGRPLVLVHGSGPATTAWSAFGPIIPSLAERFRVLAPDMPGWGNSTATPFDGARQVPALVSFLDTLGLETAAVAGNSMGGMTAIRLTAEHPDRVSHLITLSAPAPGTDTFTPAGLPTEAQTALFATYQDPSPENFRRLTSALVFDQSLATDEPAKQRAAEARAHPEHLRNFLTGITQTGATMAAYLTLTERLTHLASPSLVIHGRDDRLVSYESGLRLVAALRDSRLLLLNQCGHWPQVEHADEVGRTITGFIDNQPPSQNGH